MKEPIIAPIEMSIEISSSAQSGRGRPIHAQSEPITLTIQNFPATGSVSGDFRI